MDWNWNYFSIFLLCIFLFKYLFRFIFYKIVFKKYVSEFQDLDKLKMASNLISVWIGFKILQLFVPTLFINPGFAVPVIKGVDFVAATLMVLIFINW